ncbi:MAG: RDD family protein [Myxococcales bacterium]|nr:RDD family protein [Myxococcales bacterium]
MSAHEIPDGARCAEHPEDAAATVCHRCGGFACEPCTRLRDGERHCAACLDLASPLADPAKRLAAYVLDAVIQTAPGLTLLVGLMMTSDLVAIAVAALGAALLLGVLAVNLIWLHRYGQTIGKRLIGVRIVAKDGTRIGAPGIVFKRILFPMAVGMIPVLGTFFVIADPLFIFGPGRQCLHDMIADTIVVAAPEPPRAYRPA